MTIYFIETRCFTVTDISLFTGTEIELKARLNEFSDLGWMTVCAYELAPVRLSNTETSR